MYNGFPLQANQYYAHVYVIQINICVFSLSFVILAYYKTIKTHNNEQSQTQHKYKR